MDNVLSKPNSVLTTDQEKVLKGDAKTISKLYDIIPKAKAEMAILKTQKEEFINHFKADYSKYLIYGFMCILALFFDYFVSSRTMKPLTGITKLDSRFIALIFSLMDAAIAIVASGILAKSVVSIVLARKKWRPVLWGLCGIKLILFVATATIISNHRVSPIGMIIMVALMLLVYVILDFAGGGLYVIFNFIKFWLRENILIDNPSQKQQKLNKCKTEFIGSCKKYDIPIQAAIEHFKLAPIFNNN